MTETITAKTPWAPFMGDVGPDDAVFVDREKRDLKSLFLQLFQRMEHGMVLKGGGDDVALPLFGAQCGRRADRLVICLAAARGKEDLLGLGADHRGDLLPGFFQDLLCLLSVPIQAGRVSPGLMEKGCHRLDGSFTHFCRCCVVRIDHAFRLPSILAGVILYLFAYYVNRCF